MIRDVYTDDYPTTSLITFRLLAETGNVLIAETGSPLAKETP